MSLDVYLTLHGSEHLIGDHIFIREHGQNVELTRAEWDIRFPGKEPIVVSGSANGEVYSRNITHNLGHMAAEAGIYEALWRPEEIGLTHADQLIAPLSTGLALLKSDPNRFKAFNPSNGWGTYEGLVDFVEAYLAACQQYPAATVSVWR